MTTSTLTINGNATTASNIYVPATVTMDGTYDTYDVALNGGTGNDTLFAYSGPANWLAYTTAHPTQALHVTNAVYGGNGKDVLYSSVRPTGMTVDQAALYSHADTLAGGIGNDTYILRDTGATIVEAVGPTGGTDTIQLTAAYLTANAGISFRLSDYVGVENVVFSGAAAGILTGSDDANVLTGNLGNDYLTGGQGNDTVNGAAGGDSLFGGNDDDVLFGGLGDDNVQGDWGNDRVNGGDGNDQMTGGDGNDSLQGNAGDDFVYGGAGTDTLLGGAGNDELQADGGSHNILRGDDGDDRLYSDTGNDNLSGGTGKDTLVGQDGIDSLYGGTGVDSLYGGADNDALFGGDDADTVGGDEGNDLAYGGAGNDDLYGGADFDTLYGGTENDGLYGGDGNDILRGDAGNDLLSGDADDDQISGGAGDDNLRGDTGNDTLWGGDGNDGIYGGDGDDLIAGGTGFGFLSGNDGNDTIIGSTDGSGDDMYGGDGDDLYVLYAAGSVDENSEGGTDTVATGAFSLNADDFDNVEALLLVGTANLDLTGGESATVVKLTGNDGNNDVRASSSAGATALFGGGGNDTLWGSVANDTLTGGLGSDQMRGAGGTDTFVFDTTSNGTDTIQDFESGVDGEKIDFSALHITSIEEGSFVGGGTHSAIVELEHSQLTVRVDTDGNGTADFSIILLGNQIELDYANFIYDGVETSGSFFI